MGEDVAPRQFTERDREQCRVKLGVCLEVLAGMLEAGELESDQSTVGLEIELNLVDSEHHPAMRNDRVLSVIANDDFQTELGQFNIEINVPPQGLGGRALHELESRLRSSLNDADHRSRTVGAHIVMIGILPTLSPADLTAASLSANPRYALLNEQILAARGDDFHIAIDGPERLSASAETIAPEAACTSVQLHLQVSPQSYAAHWNAAQCIAGVQLALGANAPFFFGKELWRETRVALFEQATDTRSEELKARGVRPRVWFGERWITSVLDQFEENIRYFPALLPICDDEDPTHIWEGGGTPQLAELRLHNGTVYRWNRPIYDVHQGKAHLRVENRVLPAGPTVVDVLANGAFYYGLVRALALEDRPVWSQMEFTTAEDNFEAGARHGINARISWPGLGVVPATELVLHRLLPMAREGLDSWGVDTSVTDRLLGIIEGRCATRVNGSEWQARTFHRIRDAERLEPFDAVRKMQRLYVDHMHSNQPVHTWPLI